MLPLYSRQVPSHSHTLFSFLHQVSKRHYSRTHFSRAKALKEGAKQAPQVPGLRRGWGVVGRQGLKSWALGLRFPTSALSNGPAGKITSVTIYPLSSPSLLNCLTREGGKAFWSAAGPLTELISCNPYLSFQEL